LWRAAARRFLTLLAILVAVAVALGAVLGLVTGSSLNRSISLVFYGAGAFLVAGGFVFGIRGPYRSVSDEGTIRVGRRLQRVTPEERQESVNITVLLVVLGFVMLAIGAAVDTRYELI
jgi:hypothetical protein